MKKQHVPPIFLFITLATAVLFAFATARTTLADSGPHGGYDYTTETCSACHRTHTGQGAFVLSSAAQDNAFCYTCHNGTGVPEMLDISTHSNMDYDARAEADFSLNCVHCHEPHGSVNLYAVKEYVVVQDGAVPTTNGPVAFTVVTGTNSYDDGTSVVNSRLCVTCHADSGNVGYPMTTHVGGADHGGGADYAGQDCTACHAHSVDNDLYTQDGFMASCTSCHGQPPDGAGSHATHFAPTPIGPQISPGGGSDGILNYRFYATDGGAQATATPPVSGTNTVAMSANNEPMLTWQAGACRAGGVSPRTGAVDAGYEFLVNYTDADNGCPASGSSDIQVWVDLDGNGYDAGEQHNLTEVSAADTDCTDGKLYSTIRTLGSTGDLHYRFYASDGATDASGSPTADSVVSVIDAIKVRVSGGSGWQSSVQAGIDASSDGNTILVYPRDDFAAETYYEDVLLNTATNNRTIRAVCGPDLTIIDGVNYAIATQHSSNVVIDGFTLTGANDGVNVNNTSPLTIQNCAIHGNNRGIYSFDTRNDLIVSNCEIYDNITTGAGAGVYFNSGAHQIISTTITSNQASNGGGVYCQSACQLGIRGSIIISNTGTNAGGGIYLLSTGSRAVITDTFIRGNDSGGNGGGGIYVENGTSASLTNVMLTGNRTTGLGGAVNERGYASYLFCTLSGNYAANGGGAIYHLTLP